MSTWTTSSTVSWALSALGCCYGRVSRLSSGLSVVSGMCLPRPQHRQAAMLTCPQCARIQHRVSCPHLPPVPCKSHLPHHAVHTTQDTSSDLEVLATIHSQPVESSQSGSYICRHQQPLVLHCLQRLCRPHLQLGPSLCHAIAILGWCHDPNHKRYA